MNPLMSDSESRNECACCGSTRRISPIPIVSQDHDEFQDAENLICLCHDCRLKVDTGELTAAKLKEFKDKPRAARDFEKKERKERRVTIKVVLSGENEVNQSDFREFVISAIAKFDASQK